MHVLLISLDSGMFTKKSDVAERLRKYTKHVDFLSVIAYTPAHGFKPVRIAKNAVVYPTNSRTSLLFPWQAVNMGSKIHEKNPVSVIVTQDAHATGLAGMLLKQKYGIPLQVQLHGDYINNKWWLSSSARRLLNKLGVRVVRQSDNIRVVSKRVEKRLLALGISKSRIVRFPIFVDVKRFEKSRARKISGNLIFLFVGRLAEEKNIPLLLRAFAGLKFPKGKLVIVGEGEKKSRLISLSRQLKIDRQVVFVGRADPAPYYKAATALVLPSLHEGWGLVAVEAAAAGCPIVMTNVGCAGEVIINNKSGLVVPVNNLKGLQDAMRRMTNEQLRKRLSQNAARIVKKLPSEAETVKMLVDSWKVIQ